MYFSDNQAKHFPMFRRFALLTQGCLGRRPGGGEAGKQGGRKAGKAAKAKRRGGKRLQGGGEAGSPQGGKKQEGIYIMCIHIYIHIYIYIYIYM